MSDHPVIIVGVDDSATSRRALSWALAEAQRLGAVVEVVTTFDESVGEPARERAQGVQDAVVTEAVSTATDPVPPLASLVMAGDAVDVLVRLSGHGHLLVIGRHSTAGLRHSAESPTADRVTQLACCPVTIVPGASVLPEHAGLAATVG